MLEKVAQAIHCVKGYDPFKVHEEVKSMYNWHEVAERTEKVYDRMSMEENITILERLIRLAIII
jgi:phosphatidylinositol glycan class A protein